MLNLTWHKAIKEIKKGTAYSEYTLKQESVALLKDIHRYYGAFELTFFEESKKTLIYQSKELNIKDIDMNYPIKMNSAIRIVWDDIMRLKLLLLTLTTLPLIAHADLPLTVEDILADKNRFKLDTELSYFNQQKTSAVAQGFNSVYLGGGWTIYLPNIGESNTNTDSLIASFGLRYGVSDRLETGIKANGVYRNDRHQIMFAHQFQVAVVVQYR